jgi:cohesin loading factor subunit SCC2
MAYVEVPPLPSAWRTPSKKQPLPTSMSTPADNFDALGSEEDDVRYNFGIHASVKLSARRPGDRDERGRKISFDVSSIIHLPFSTPRKTLCAY